MRLFKFYLRKLYHLIAFLSLFLVFIIPVKADTIINIQYGGSAYSELYYLNNLPYDNWSVNSSGTWSDSYSCNSSSSCYQAVLDSFQSSGHDYYSIFLSINPQSGHIGFNAYFFDFSSSDSVIQDSGLSNFTFYKESNSEILAIILSGWSDPNYNNFYLYYDSNFNFINHGDFVFKGFYDNENDNYNNMLQVHDDESMPKIKDLLQYSSWSDYVNNHLSNYTEVNLDNYEYVLLSFKDYSQSQPFQTNLQVKGMIGITPIYNYGQTSKDSITGSQVQDRCNISYSSYTSYPLYILQSDLQNNSIYAVKSCSSGSSFKFDSSVFDITYITQSNLNDPTITINGQTYHTIPYSDLPSTATKNEINNYIPGESGSASSSGGIDSAIKSVQQSLSALWNTFTYFTEFVGLIFSSLPTELRTILLSAFVVAITIGLIKLFTN